MRRIPSFSLYDYLEKEERQMSIHFKVFEEIILGSFKDKGVLLICPFSFIHCLSQTSIKFPGLNDSEVLLNQSE